MASTVAGRIDEIILARFEPDEDLYLGLEQVAIDRDIKTGVVMSIVGGLATVNVSYFDQKGTLETVRSVDHSFRGPVEVSGQGIIGLEEDGKPYLHVHLTFTGGDGTVCGHLRKGTRVRSLLPVSHFTVFIARVTGAELRSVWDHEARRLFPDVYPKGAPYHVILEVK